MPISIKDAGVWKNVGNTHIKDAGVWKSATPWINDAGTWKATGAQITAITIAGNASPDHSVSEDYTVTIDFDDGSQSTDCTLLTWSLILYDPSHNASITGITSSACTVDVGGDDGDTIEEFTVRAEAPNGTFDELVVDVTCVPATTWVLMADGTQQQMFTIKRGDLVKAYDTQTGQVSNQRVAYVLHRVTQKSLLTFHLSTGGHVSATPEHLVCVYRDGELTWGTAKDLCCGDTLLDSNLSHVEIVRIEAQHDNPVEVMNLEVEKAHTYFSNDVLLHNQGFGDPTSDNPFGPY